MKDKKAEGNMWMIISIIVLAIIMLWGTFFTGGVNEQAIVDGIVIGLTPLLVIEDSVVPEAPVIPEIPEVIEPEVIKETPDYDWEELAWEQVLDEFEDDDEFYTCKGHEYDDDEYDFDIESISVRFHKGGDVTVTLEIEFDFEDNSDNRDCKVDRTFEVFWDDDDVEDEDWDEAEVEWIRGKVSTA